MIVQAHHVAGAAPHLLVDEVPQEAQVHRHRQLGTVYLSPNGIRIYVGTCPCYAKRN